MGDGGRSRGARLPCCTALAALAHLTHGKRQRGAREGRREVGQEVQRSPSPPFFLPSFLPSLPPLLPLNMYTYSILGISCCR